MLAVDWFAVFFLAPLLVMIWVLVILALVMVSKVIWEELHG